MADLEKTVRVIFAGQNDLSKTVTSISRDMDRFAGGVKNATQPLADAHDFILRMEAALGALAIGGLALSIVAAKDFDSQFREISTLIDDVGGDVDQFKGEIQSYASESVKSIDDINASIYAAISAGTDYEDALDLITIAEKLAVAGKAGLQESTVLLASVMNAYGAETEEAAHYSDVFFKTVKMGQTTLPELAAALSQVTSIAAAADVPIETVTAAIAHLTAQGMPTTEAMTALRGVLQALIKPSSEAVKYASELGIEFNAQALASKGLEGVLIDVYEATEGNVDSVAKLFGNVQGLTGVLSAVGKDGGEAFIAASEEMRNATVATATAFEKMSDDINLVNQRLANNVRLTLVEVGDRILGDYGDIAGSISDIFKSIQQAIQAGSFDEIFDALSSISGGINQAFSDIAKNLPEALAGIDFSRFSQAIEQVSAEAGQLIRSIFGDFDFSTADGLQKVIERIVSAMTSLTEVTAGIVQGWQPWAKAISDVVDRMASFDTETNNAIGRTLQIGKVVNELTGLIGGLSGALSGLGNLLNVLAAKNMVNLVTSLVSGTRAVAGMQTAVAGLMGSAAGQAGLLGMAGAIGYTAGTLINDHVPAVGKAAQAVIGWADDLLDFSGKQERATKEAAAFDRLVESLSKNIGSFAYDLSGIRTELEAMGYEMESLPDSEVIRLAAEVDILSWDEAMEIARARIPEEETISVSLDSASLIDWSDAANQALESVGGSAGRAGDEIRDAFDEDVTIIGEIIPDEASIAKTKKAIEDEIPPEKLMRIQADLDIAQIKAEAETLQGMIEWKAKLDIAQVEAAAKNLETLVGGIEEVFQSTGSVISGLTGEWAKSGGLDQLKMERWIKNEYEMREKAAEQQAELTEQQIKMNEMKLEALAEGEALININAEGLEPDLEMILWKIIEKVQVRATAAGSEFLLGL